jgi:hypothetical protein
MRMSAVHTLIFQRYSHTPGQERKKELENTQINYGEKYKNMATKEVHESNKRNVQFEKYGKLYLDNTPLLFWKFEKYGN